MPISRFLPPELLGFLQHAPAVPHPLPLPVAVPVSDAGTSGSGLGPSIGSGAGAGAGVGAMTGIATATATAVNTNETGQGTGIGQGMGMGFGSLTAATATMSMMAPSFPPMATTTTTNTNANATDSNNSSSNYMTSDAISTQPLVSAPPPTIPSSSSFSTSSSASSSSFTANQSASLTELGKEAKGLIDIARSAVSTDSGIGIGGSSGFSPGNNAVVVDEVKTLIQLFAAEKIALSAALQEIQQASSTSSRQLEVDMQQVTLLTQELTGLRTQLTQARQGLDQLQVGGVHANPPAWINIYVHHAPNNIHQTRARSTTGDVVFMPSLVMCHRNVPF